MAHLIKRYFNWINSWNRKKPTFHVIAEAVNTFHFFTLSFSPKLHLSNTNICIFTYLLGSYFAFVFLLNRVFRPKKIITKSRFHWLMEWRNQHAKKDEPKAVKKERIKKKKNKRKMIKGTTYVYTVYIRCDVMRAYSGSKQFMISRPFYTSNICTQ